MNLRELMFRAWYWYVNKIDNDADILFMNYGYEDITEIIDLNPEDEPNRYSIQLYHRLAKAVEMKNKDIVEIGCGRGGGLAYITKRFNPANSLGIDLNQTAAEFGNSHYSVNGMSFKQGDAQNLSLPDNSFDVVLNVESSHRYPLMENFLSEVNRILRQGGYFLYTDFRYDYEMPELEKFIENTKLTCIEKQNINKEVVAALKADTPSRKQLVKKLAPKILHKTALNFAGVADSETYNQFLSGKYVYYLYILQKQ